MAFQYFLINLFLSLFLVSSFKDAKKYGIYLDEKPTPKIVGGIESDEVRYPYQVALISKNIQFCAGTLIDSRWILSAAHCHGYATHVEIGRHDLSNKTEVYEQIPVESEITHPRYNKKTFNYDFMLIKLKHNVSSKYTPIKLDDGFTRLSKRLDLTVIGWGRKGTDMESSEVLLEAEVDYMPLNECKRRYKVTGEKIFTSMLCASRFGKDSCQGDSGGPLIIKGVNSSYDVQIGIVSWGYDCADCRFPGVYSRVRKAVDFIEKFLH